MPLPLPGVIVNPKGLRGAVRWVIVELPGERDEARLAIVRRRVKFALEFDLVAPSQVTELVEMLLSGAAFEDAVIELRATRPPDLPEADPAQP